MGFQADSKESILMLGYLQSLGVPRQSSIEKGIHLDLAYNGITAAKCGGTTGTDQSGCIPSPIRNSSTSCLNGLSCSSEKGGSGLRSWNALRMA